MSWGPGSLQVVVRTGNRSQDREARSEGRLAQWGTLGSDWLAERFTLLGVTFQNWMILALAIILVGVLIAWWRQW